MCSAMPPADRRVRRLLQWATARLRTCLADAPAGSAETPYLDALLLLGVATGYSTDKLMASMPDEVGEKAVSHFASLVGQRCTGIPVSYIRGWKEFYGREFTVSPAVLVPRPDTEILVEATIEAVDSLGASSPHVHDTCTGSGCVAITLAAERPDVEVSASDISEDALRVARHNRDVLIPGRRLEIWRSDLLENLTAEGAERGLPPPGIIAANPPYLTDNEFGAMRAAGWPEPELALRAGTDGLDVLRRLARQAVTILPDGGYLICEIGPDQGASGTEILVQHGFSEVHVRQDLAGRDRVAVARM